VRLVHHHQGVLGQIVEEGRRRLSRGTSRQVAGVVLDAVAVAGLAEHLEIEHRSLVEPLGLQELPLRLELGLLLEELRLDRLYGVGETWLRSDVVTRRVDRHLSEA
jgi:hypothetical protein